MRIDEITTWIYARREESRVELEIASRERAFLQPLIINLRWNDQQDAEPERQKDPLKTLGKKLPSAAFAEGEPGTHPGQQHKQRHMPGIEVVVDENAERVGLRGILDKPGQSIEDHGRMKHD